MYSKRNYIVMETKEIDLSWLVYLLIMITIFTIAV